MKTAVMGLAALLLSALIQAEGKVVVPPTNPVELQQDSGVLSYDASGIRVIQRVAATSEIVVAKLYLLGGVRMVTQQNAGIERLLLDVSERGTRIYAKDQLRRAMARLGTRIVVGSHADWSFIEMQSTRSTLDSTWRILASRVMEPLLEPAEVEIIRQQMLAAVRQRDDSPDALVEFLADSFAFAGHKYSLAPVGTEASLASLTAAELKRFHEANFVKSRMLLVVIGNASRERVETLVRQTLGRLPIGSYAWSLPDTLPRSRSAAITVDRPLPTNYILGLYAGPKAGTRDYHALRVATAILSGQLFSEVRSRRNLTYAVDAPFIERAIAAGGLYVTTVSPDVTMEVMHQQIMALRGGFVDQAALERLILQFTTQYFLDNESATEQADFLARAQLYFGDHRRAARFEEELRAITPDDVRRVAERYMRDVRFVYVGDARRAPLRVMQKF